MNQAVQKAAQLLDAGDFTCVLCRGEEIHTSTRRGVAPLMSWLETGTDLRGFSAADKVVGKATALLYCLLGVRAVYARVMSRAAIAVFEQQNMPYFYDTVVDAIRNRAGDGLCPMETATRDISDPALAPDAIRKALAALTKGS